MPSHAPWPVLLLAWGLDQGGTERQVAQLARALDRRRFAPHVAAFQAHGMRAQELAAAGVPVVEFPVRSFLRPSIVPLAWKFLRWLRRHRIAVVHAFDPPMAMFGVPLARLAGVPVVLSSLRGERRFYPRAYHGPLAWTDRLATGIVANSEYMRQMAARYGADPARVTVCYNGLDTDLFHAAGRRRMPGLEDAACVVGCVAALRPEKRLETLLAAFAAVLPKHPETRLVLVGSGQARPALEAQAAALGLGARVWFVPATAEVAPWYRSIDIFVLPSESEAFSNSLLEAMACGCAVVASAVGGNPEAVTPETGRLFPAGDAAALAGILDTLMAAPELRQQLAAQAARRAAQQFSRAASVARMEDLYQRLLGSRGG
jgi:glycosyltransferase involved in cell wall biosynthesis